MKVLLKRNFFCGGSLYRATPTGTEVPDEYLDLLPKDASILTSNIEEKIIPVTEAQTLSALAKAKKQKTSIERQVEDDGD